MEDLINRVWFIPNGYINNHLQRNWRNYDKPLIPSDYETLNFTEIKSGPYIFLSRSPITFGHSIIVIPKPPKRDHADEQTFFKWSANYISYGINRFNFAFNNLAIHTERKFKTIAEFTKTKGNYIKTLVLKASANENTSMVYKIHLIPYFNSHHLASQKRFKNLYPDYKLGDLQGGLLGWIGEQEDQVDKTEIKLLLGFENNENALSSELEDLALLLRKTN